ncbi:MAG TPA: polysaccharide biosynthesis C-terminal domain-containing protein [Fluviicola sp.]|nr:polysaccharide biosynthesis C-terminal domain-containing protein [Fluviicola sp.]
MGIIQKDAIRTTIISYLGLILGYVNKGVLFVIFLSTEQIGLLNLLVSVGLLFAQLSNLGMSYSVWRFFPFFRNKEKKNHGFFQLSMLVTLCGIILFSILTIVFENQICELFIEKSSSFVHYYYWLLPIGISYALFLTLDNFLRSLYKNIVSVIATELLMRLAVTAAVVFYAFGWIDFFQLLVLHSLSFLVPTLILLAQLFRNKELNWRVSQIRIPQRFRRIFISYSLYSYVNFIGILIVISLDTIMVASMLGLSETGVFSTVIYIVSGLQIPYKSLIRISSPFVAKYWKERDMVKMKDLYTRVSSIGLVIGAFVFLCFWANRVEIFHFLPEEYDSGIPVFLILMVGRLVDMYCGINGVIVVSSKKYKYDIVFMLVLLAAVFLLNWYWIPIYGIYGAAMATTIAYVVYNALRLIFVFSAYRIHPLRITQLKVFTVFLATFGVTYFLPVLFGNDFISIVVKLFLVTIAFLGTILLFRLDEDVTGYLNKAIGWVIPKKEKEA